MFTGIVEETGEIMGLNAEKYGSLTVKAVKVLEDVHLGDSIAVNGVCLTVVDFDSTWFKADVMGETIRRTSLGDLKKGSQVNLERAMSASGRFGGHIVSGHIDGTGSIGSFVKEGNAVWVTVLAEESLLKYVAEKGSIAVDGISLTVACVQNGGFKVSIIPHTGSETNLLNKNQGDIVNLETDIIAKYVERLMETKKNESRVDMDFLTRCGF